MRRLTTIAGGLLILGMVGSTVRTQRGAPAPAEATRPLVTGAQYERWQKELSNWGRWGTNDELGALNLITPAKRRQAAALVREGVTVSLASVAQTEQAVDVPCPNEWAMLTLTEAGATDRIAYPCIHGAGTTHLDAFAHRFVDGRMWNGYPASGLVTQERGAARNSVLTMKDGIVTRGVLYDIPRLKGVPYLEPGTRIFPEDLEAWEERTGVRVGPGDALLLRWGRWARRTALGPWPIQEGAAGFDVSIIPWLKRRDIAVLGWETPSYVPQPPGDLPSLAVHDFVLTLLGVHLLDRADFDALSEIAAARKRWEFMVTIAPLPIPRGTGSPVNPIAVF
jgi:kynurenine formamidase